MSTASTMTITSTHHEAQTHAVQRRHTYRTRRHGWTSAAEFQRARRGRGVVIPGGVREEDRRTVFVREGFYVVRDVVIGTERETTTRKAGR